MPRPNVARSLVRRCRRLMADRAYRDNQRLFFVDGVRNVIAARRHGWKFEAIIRSRVLLQSGAGRKIANEIVADGTSLEDVSPETFRKISYLPRASGLAAVVHQKWTSLSAVERSQSPLWLGLSRIRSAGNLGTLLRSSAAAGGSGIILFGDNIDPYSPALVRAAMGAIFSQMIVRTSWTEFEKQNGGDWHVIGADGSARNNFRQQEIPRGTVIMLGDERRGLSSRQKACCDEFVRIPMQPETDSLNIGVAGSLLLYHALDPE